jgi:hypothetical protein
MGTGVGRLKNAAKHMAALDFLSSITMINEAAIKQNAIAKSSAKVDKQANVEVLELFPDNMPPDGPGRMLPGVQAQELKLPPELRYKMRYFEQRHELKRWEDQALTGGFVATTGVEKPQILNTRLFFSRARAYPLSVCSIIQYNAEDEKARLDNIRGEDVQGHEVFNVAVRDWRGSSYENVLRDVSADLSTEHVFDIFDDNDMRYGSGHRHLVRGGIHTGPSISSIILYSNEKDLRESVNEQFIDKYPDLPESLNISAVRDLTVGLARACLDLNIELSTGALAYICFERLCLQGIITGRNRNLCMGVSLLLAFKYSEYFLEDLHKGALQSLLEFIDGEWGVGKNELFQAEFGAYALLNFTLHVSQDYIMVIYYRLLKFLRLSSDRYLAGYKSNR